MGREKQCGSTQVELIILDTIHPKVFPSTKHCDMCLGESQGQARLHTTSSRPSLSLIKMVNGFQLLFMSFVLLRHKWLYDSNSD